MWDSICAFIVLGGFVLQEKSREMKKNPASSTWTTNSQGFTLISWVLQPDFSPTKLRPRCLPVQAGSAPVRISVGQDKEGSLTENSHIRHARDGIIQTVQVVDIPDDYEKQVAEKRKLLEDYLSGAG